jgi:hypothetical protein
MTDSLLDDVKALLNKDFGDDRILKQICRACENDEVVSNYERNYVRKLAEKHLGKKPEFVQTPSVEKKHVVPDAAIPEIQHIPQTQTFQMESPRISHSNSKNKKIFLGLGIIAIVAIIASIASFGEVTDGTNDDVDDILASFLIETDLTSYNKKDLISINGVSDTSGTVILSIENPDNELVWTEQISLKSDGRFSTLTIAGGQGWESSGIYTIKVDNGVETKTSTFSFTT